MIVSRSEYLILECGENGDCEWIRVSYFGV